MLHFRIGSGLCGNASICYTISGLLLGVGDFGPPMEAGSAFDGVAVIREGGAPLADDFVEVFDCSDVLVDDGLVDERPRCFGWLRFR